MKTATRRSLGGLAAAALAVTLCTVGGGQAQAAPAMTLAQAKAQVLQLQMDAAALDQKSDGIDVQITAAKTAMSQRDADLKAQTAQVATMRTQLGQLALAQFQNRNFDTRAQLFVTQDTQGFLSQISTVQKISDNQTATLQNFQAQQARLADLQRAQTSGLADLQNKQTALAASRADSEQKIAAAKTVLAQLTEEQRQKIAAEEAKQDAAARKAATAAAAGASADARTAVPTDTTTTTSSTSSTSSTSGADSAATAAPSSSGKGATALAFALKQQGKPYSFGAEGPGSYDCSGLTLAAWKAAGVSLSRTSQSQFHDGVAVAKSDLQPGDLVFFYGSNPDHVALYAGNGYVVHAPHPGSSVTLIKMSYMPYSGARRPG